MKMFRNSFKALDSPSVAKIQAVGFTATSTSPAKSNTMGAAALAVVI